MNFKLSKKAKRLLTVLFVLLVLTGCTKITGEDGKILADKIIYFTSENFTTWGSMFQNESWFAAIFIWPLAQLVNFFAQFMNVGLSVVLVTIISRLITLPMTIKQTVQSQKMQMIQPKLTKIQAKYAGKEDEQSKMAMSQEMMNLYNKYDINPLGTILYSFVPFPIMIAIWQAVQRAESVVFGEFLSLQMDMLPMTAITSDLAGSGWKYLILIAILGVTQFASMKLPQYLAQRNMKAREKEAAKAANQQTNTMTYSMLIMIVFMSLSMPTAMSFYWIVSAAVQAIQTVLIQKRYVDHE